MPTAVRRITTGARAFGRLCADLGFEHSLAPPMRPATNGIVARLNGRIEDVRQSHQLRNSTTLAPAGRTQGRTPLEPLGDWHSVQPELVKDQLNYRP